MVFCTEGPSERWRRAQTTSQPTAKPAATPPAAPTTKVVISTSPTASSVIGLTLALKSRQLVKSAETYSKGGKNNRNTSSGSSSTGGSPGTNPSADPPRTSRIG